MTIIGSCPDLCVANVAASVAWYCDVLGLDVLVDHGWYSELGLGGRTLVAFVQAGHETVPPPYPATAAGVLVSFEVTDAEPFAEEAARLGVTVRLPLVEELGQRHLMLVDPDGWLVDIIQRIPLTRADLGRLAKYRKALRAEVPIEPAEPDR